MAGERQTVANRFRDLTEQKLFQPNSEPLDPYQVLMNYVETAQGGHSWNEVGALAMVSIATDVRALLDVVSRIEIRGQQ